MESGMQQTLQEFMPEIFQEQIAGVQDRHANRSAWPEKEKDSTGKADSLEKSSDCLMNYQKKIDPNGLFMRTLKECLVQIKDGIMPQSSLKWTGGGYDIEWQNINSAWFVPQNRERIYTIGHNRRYGSKKIFPVQGTDGENNICQIGQVKSERDNPNRYRVYDPKGVSPCLSGTSGGGRQPYISFMDLTIGGV